MRQGHNPAKKDVPAYQPHRLGIFSIVHIPFEGGFFAEALDIFRYHLVSLKQYTPEPFDYLVFDNGSCPEVKRELQRLHEGGLIDWLVLSRHNLGKTGAQNMILGSMPNEWVCYTDSDMLFRPGWLEESWKIHETFPGPGMSGAQLVFPDWEVDKGNSEFRKTSDPAYRFEQVHPEGWIVEEYCRARGICEDMVPKVLGMLLDQVTDTRSGVKAILGGNSHQQFLAPRTLLQQALPLPSALQLNRKQTTYLDEEIDRLGNWHLTTTVPYLYHMGNEIEAAIVPELQRLDLSLLQVEPEFNRLPTEEKNHPAFRALNWMSSKPAPRRALERLYDNLYRVLS